MKESFFEGKNGFKIIYYTEDEAVNPKAVLQISHGLAEHALRYEGFAKFMNQNGYIVAADDHRGHGKTAEKPGFAKGDSFNDTIEDMHILTGILKEKYKLPIFLLGHSYGSFLSQGYIERYASDIKGVILSGSGLMNGIAVKMGGIIANIQSSILGKEKTGNLINKMSFGGYDKPFLSENQEFSWLSRDINEVKKYIADPLCGYPMSLGFYKYFFKGLKTISLKKEIANIKKDLPVYLISGSHDPVGERTKLVLKLKSVYEISGITQIEMKFYPEARHEILNETNKTEVYGDIIKFIEKNNT